VSGGKGLFCEAVDTVADETKREERGAGRWAATLAGRAERVEVSDMAGELLRVDPSVKEDESETRSELLRAEFA
jgi:hypothetical protein